MKVIISCLNSKYVHASLSPWCLLAGIREFSKKAHESLIVESTINSDFEAFAEKMENIGSLEWTQKGSKETGAAWRTVEIQLYQK